MGLSSNNVIFFPLVANVMYEPKSLAITNDKLIVYKSKAYTSFVRPLVLFLLIASIVALLLSVIYSLLVEGLIFGIIVIAVSWYFAFKGVEAISIRRKFFTEYLKIVKPVQFLSGLPNNLSLEYAYEFDLVSHIFLSKRSEECEGITFSGVEMQIDTNLPLIFDSGYRRTAYGSWYIYQQKVRNKIYGVNVEYLANLLRNLGLGDKIVII